MALNIKDPEADRLVRELADLTGESITTAVATAVRERLERLHGASPAEQRLAAIRKIAERAASRPLIREFREEDLYDEYGLPC